MKIYTAFVSSTYLDLVDERRLIIKELQGDSCLPLAMETFPSTGDNQWRFIEESLRIADFCVFVIAGKYGSIDPSTGIGWTHREYRAALALGKRTIVLVNRAWKELPLEKRETSSHRIALLEAFHEEISSSGQNYVPFGNSGEMVGGMMRSVKRLIDDGVLEGWTRPSEAGGVSVAYDDVSVNARFTRSSTVPSSLDLDYSSRRAFRGRLPRGVSRLPISWGRANDSFLPFGPHNNPNVQLVMWTRSRPGEIRLIQRKQSATLFVFDVAFEPPLRYEESADIQVDVHLDGFTYLYAEDQVEATRNSVDGVRSFGSWSWTPTRPTKHLDLKVDVESTACGSVRGFSVDPKLVDWSASERTAVEGSAEYSKEQLQIGGVGYSRMQVSVDHPVRDAKYMLSWNLLDRERRT